MPIPDEDIARLREGVDLVSLVGEYVKLRRVGQRWTGLCPFHAEKSASFGVNPDLGIFHCFGCQTSGDAITFVREIQHLDFLEAVEFLASKSGVTIHYEDPDDGARRSKRGALKSVMSAALAFYHGILLSSPEAGDARVYLRERGFTSDMVRGYQMGWAPDRYGYLASELGVDQSTLIDAGLMHAANDGRPPGEMFAGRILFPIFSPAGDPIAFGGRHLPGGKGPKYKNSPDGILYNKSKVLYGLNWAKADIVAQDTALVCEGYTDAIASRQAGVTIAVATCGTAFTEDHAKMLARHAHNIVLAFDADSAGQSAAARFHEWESRYGFNVSVVSLPDGTDPGDFASTNPMEYAERVAHPTPLLRVRMERALSGHDMTAPEGRAAAAKAAMSVIAEHPDRVLQSQYLAEIADRTGTAESVLSDHTPVASHSTTVATPATADAVVMPPDNVEFEALRVFLKSRDDIEPFLDPVLFTDQQVIVAFLAARQWPTTADALTQCDDPMVAPILAYAAVEGTESDAFEVAKLLLRRAVERKLKDVVAETLRPEADSGDLLAQVSWAKQMLPRLNEPEVRSAVDTYFEFVFWLTPEDKSEPHSPDTV